MPPTSAIDTSGQLFPLLSVTHAHDNHANLGGKVVNTGGEFTADALSTSKMFGKFLNSPNRIIRGPDEDDSSKKPALKNSRHCSFKHQFLFEKNSSCLFL